MPPRDEIHHILLTRSEHSIHFSSNYHFAQGPRTLVYLLSPRRGKQNEFMTIQERLSIQFDY